MGVAKLCLLVMTAIHTASCVDQRDFFPFGTTAGDERLIGNDVSSVAINIRPFKYFGDSYPRLHVITNGVISFGLYGPLADLRVLTLNNLPKSRYLPPIIAPFWNDIDLSQGAGRLWYRQSTDYVLLRKASTEIGSHFPAAWIFVATWHEVRFNGANSLGKLRKNTFQVVLAADATRENSYVIFNYNKLEWDSSVSNGGRPATGLGGTSPAIAGFDSGDGTNFVELPGSFTADVRRLASKSNVGIPGKWIFNVKNRPVKVTCDKNGPCKRGQCYTDGNRVVKCNCTGTGFYGPTCNIDDCVSHNPCVHGLCVNNGDGTVTCTDVCNKCPKTPSNAPVCGSNGHTYYHRCVVEAWNCLKKQNIIALHEGACPPQSDFCDKCHNIKSYAPVCASNGRIYYHRCVLETWNCLNKQHITTRPDGECPPHEDCNKCPNDFTFAPVCGTDGYTYYSRCVMESWSCLNSQTTTVNYVGECPRQKHCNQCPFDRLHLPVCGSNGYTYTHRCVLYAWNCKKNTNVTVVHDGECPPRSIDYAAHGGDGKLQPHAMLLLSALGLCHVMYYM